MGRKKTLNPMDAYRRKKKKQQLAKNKRKRAEAKDKALQRRDPEWIMAEIQKLNRREKQDHGRNEEKHTNRRKKLLEAYDRAVRIRKMKQKTQKNTSDNTSKPETNDESSPSPPPIEQLEHIPNITEKSTKTHNANNTAIATHTSTTTTNTNNNANVTPHIVNYPNINATANMYNPLYHNPLLMHPHPPLPPYSMPVHAMYTDTMGAKSSNPGLYTHGQQNQANVHSAYFAGNNQLLKQRSRAEKDMFDPMNPANPKYNFLHTKEPFDKRNLNDINSVTEPAHTHKAEAPKGGPVALDSDKPKRQIEVIMDPKLQAMRPSCMRLKRKFEKPKCVRPVKKRKLNIAPDVDGSKDMENVNGKCSNKKRNNFGSGSADAAYDKFMDEISGLI